MLLLHTIVRPTFAELRRRGLALTRELVHFSKFILAEILPGRLAANCPDRRRARRQGRVQREPGAAIAASLCADSEHVGDGPADEKEKAISIQSRAVYERYLKYLTGCAKLFYDGYTDVNQFTLHRNARS